MIRNDLNVVECVEEIISKLVDDPSCVGVEITETESMTLIEVRAGNESGKIIGKGGHLAAAFRTLLESMGAREQVRYEFNIIGDGRSKGKG